MSHFTSIRTRIKDLDVLKKCLANMGYSIREGRQKLAGYSDQKTKVDLLVKMPQGYDIGFRKGPDGTWEIVADWWGVKGVRGEELRRNLERSFEEMEKEIKRRYAMEKVVKETHRMGFSVVEQRQAEDRTIKLVVRRFR